MYEDENRPFRRQGSRESSGSEGQGSRPHEFESRIFRRQTEKQVTFEDERQYFPPKGQHNRDAPPYHRPNQRQNRRSWEYSDDRELPVELRNNPLLRSGSFHGREHKQDRYHEQHDHRGQQNRHSNNQNQNRDYRRQGSHEDGRDYQRNGYDRRDNYRDIREQYRKPDNEGKENSRNGQTFDNRQLQRSQSREERKGFVSSTVVSYEL